MGPLNLVAGLVDSFKNTAALIIMSQNYICILLQAKFSRIRITHLQQISAIQCPTQCTK